MFLNTRLSRVLIAFLCAGYLLPPDYGYAVTGTKPVIRKTASRPVHPASKVAVKKMATKAVNGKTSVTPAPNPNAFIAYYNLGRLILHSIIRMRKNS